MTRGSNFASFFCELTPKEMKALDKSRIVAEKSEKSRREADSE
jgi:hypothetical protein